jgi:hypothetical protein
VGVAQLLVVIVYVRSGLAKLRFDRLAWLQPESFQHWTYVKLHRMADPIAMGLLVAEHSPFAIATAVGIIAVQLSVALVLVWPRFRPIAVAGIVAFHVLSWIALGLESLFKAAIAPLTLIAREGGRQRLGWPRRPGDAGSAADEPARARVATTGGPAGHPFEGRV